MAPLPETEIMTIKRLEVALRKMDLKLLKDGAYKLHEKYHDGFKFEYLDMLKEIFLEVSNNDSIPMDIKDILAPTIEDILTSQGISTSTATSPHDMLNQSKVSSLTSLSYEIKQEAPTQPQYQQQEPRMNAFSAFGTSPNQPQQKHFTQIPFSAEPFKEYIPQPQIHPEPQITQPIQSQFNSFNQETQETEVQEEAVQENKIQENYTPYIPQVEPINYQTVEIKEEIKEEVEEEIKKESKSIAIFYSLESSQDKTRNINAYREMISKSKFENSSMSEILALLSDINVQSNVNVSELKNLLEQLQTRENIVNLITNCQSSNLIDLMNSNEITYSIFNSTEEKRINLLPLLGLTNLFKCCECNHEYVDENSKITPLVLQCPKCKNPMFANFYTTNGENCELNMDYYNQSMIALANSKVWLLIHPVLNDKVMINLLRSALKVSNITEEIFILDKDINVRETYRKIFTDINENVKINTQITAFGDFFNIID